MEINRQLHEMRNEMSAHLRQVILPFWLSLHDSERGGYIGLVDYALRRDPDAVKGCILNSRILWFFSMAAQALDDPALLSEADHAYQELLAMTDIRNGGVYWSVHADGTVADSTKHTYNQAFAIYALSAYGQARGCRAAIEKALDLFEVIERRCRDEGGYLEAFTADWEPESNEKLSENGVMATRTMNTLLHVLEAYTGLYEATASARVRNRLCEILALWAEKMYNPQRRRQEVFFDHEYNTLIDLHSYGHDIETSWLCDHTLDVLGDESLTARIRPMLLSMADETFRLAMTDHGFANECERGVQNTWRIWWVQAEALLGFLNAYQRTGEERYAEAALSQWRYIRDVMWDRRPGSEWFWRVTEDGRPDEEKPMVEPWKCPYHNGRMVFEVLKRIPE